jgi:hypothetical protein
MRTHDAIPAEVRLALLRDALAMLDPRRNPGQRAETAAMLCEALIAEGLRRGDRAMVAETATVAAETIATGPLPAVARGALLSALGDAVALLAAAPPASARRNEGPRQGAAR